ncbi:hypothetical protein [Notoacmeibacter ruber]|uniref:EamA domain-containing protein n=1 Tax=Notoacmeibacter ruber TaxID=2670375 RepID=A0A3L7J3R3_9HYPH|nr:hypothetical protein [Notoacmeibacter ruber]RLQ85286.1 hypothetical protein D8780_15130 [Notoacmeibacter ruber]
MAVNPNRDQFALLALVGIAAALGQRRVVAAARRAEASYISPFVYVSQIYAALIVFLVYGELPSLRS